MGIRAITLKRQNKYQNGNKTMGFLRRKLLNYLGGG